MTARKNHLWTFSNVISDQAALPEIVVLLIQGSPGTVVFPKSPR